MMPSVLCQSVCTRRFVLMLMRQHYISIRSTSTPMVLQQNDSDSLSPDSLINSDELHAKPIWGEVSKGKWCQICNFCKTEYLSARYFIAIVCLYKTNDIHLFLPHCFPLAFYFLKGPVRACQREWLTQLTACLLWWWRMQWTLPLLSVKWDPRRIRKEADKGRQKKEGCQGTERSSKKHKTKDWDAKAECLKCYEVQWEGATIKDRRWRERARDEEYEVFIVSSWAWVWSSWPGDLLCSVLVPVLLHSRRPICQTAFLCFVLCLHTVLHMFDLMLTQLRCVIILFCVEIFTFKGFLCKLEQVEAVLGCRMHISCCRNQTGAWWYIKNSRKWNMCLQAVNLIRRLLIFFFFLLFAVTTFSFWHVLFSVEVQLR